MSKTSQKLRVLIVGCGNMGTSHAFSYDSIDAFEIAGLVSANESKAVLNKKLQNKYPLFSDFGVNSLRIAFACDESISMGSTVRL